MDMKDSIISGERNERVDMGSTVDVEYNQREKGFNIEQAFKEVGDFGWFQIISTLILSLVYSTTGIMWYSVTIMELMPDFTCQYKDDP